MSNIRNMNQVNPFWDFIASLQDPSNHSMFAQQHRGPPPEHEETEGADPFDGHWAGSWGPFGGPQRGPRGHGPRGPPPHGHGPRGGRRGPPPQHEGSEHGQEHEGPSHEGGPPHEGHERRSRHGPPRGPPPPHHEGGPRGPPPPHGPPPHHDTRGPSPPPPPPFAEDSASRSPTPPTPGVESAEPNHDGPPPHHRRGGRFGGRGGHGRGPHSAQRGPHGHGPGPHGHGPGPRGHGPHGHGSRGPFGGPRHGGPVFMGGAPFDISALAEAFVPGLFAGNNNSSRNGPTEDGTFTPEIDVFDTSSAYIIHGSLPGARKSDLSITYSAQRSSVCISGVVTRPDVDEDMMAKLALDERKIGSFEREVKLERGVQIEEDSIGAKLEDGVLKITVPKVQMLEDSEEEYVDVKKVELE